MTDRVTIEDLHWAAGWMGAYEDDDGVPAERSTSDDELVQRARRVMDWLDAEADRRREDADVRRVQRAAAARGRNVSTAAARAALRRTLQED